MDGSPDWPQAHLEGIRRLVRQLLGDEHSVDDVMQETWLAAIRQQPSRLDSPRGWLARVARNFALNRLRSERRRSAHERRAPHAESPDSTGDLVARIDLQRRIVDELRALHEPYRSTLTRLYLEGGSAAQVAGEHGVPAATVRTRARRGLQELRRRMDRADGERRTWRAVLLPIVLDERTAEGAVLMGVKAKIAIAAIVVLALFGAVWRLAATGLDREAPARDVRADARLAVDSANGSRERPDPTANLESAGSAADAGAEPRVLEIVVTNEAGDPIDGVQVEFRSDAGELMDRAATDAGRTHLEVVGAGRLRLRHPHRAPLVVAGIDADAMEKQVVLPDGLAITGTVVSQDGETAVRASVFAQLVTPPAWPADYKRHARTDADGGFRLVGLLPGAYELRVVPWLGWRRNGGEPDPRLLGRSRKEPFLVDAGARGVQLALAPAALLRVSIRDAETDASVLVPMEIRRVDPDAESPLLRYDTTEPGRPVEHILDVDPGEELSIRVLADGYAPSPVLRVPFVRPAETADLRVSLMPDRSSMASVRLRVRTDHGEPVPRVLILRGLGEPPTNWSGRDLEVPEDGLQLDVRPGAVAWRVRRSSRAAPFEEPLLELRLDLEPKPGDRLVRVVELERGGWVHLRNPARFVEPPEIVAADGGEPISLRPGKELGGWLTDQPVRPGAYTLRARRSAGRTIAQEITVTAGEVTIVP